MPAMQMAREPSKIEFEAKAALECGAISRQGCLEDSARGIVALRHTGVHVHPIDNVTFAEGDGCALFRAGKREWRVADLPDEPLSDVREWINPEEFRTAIAEQRDFDGEPLHGRPRMPRERKETGQGFSRALHCCRHDGVVECEVVERGMARRSGFGWRSGETSRTRGVQNLLEPLCG